MPKEQTNCLANSSQETSRSRKDSIEVIGQESDDGEFDELPKKIITTNQYNTVYKIEETTRRFFFQLLFFIFVLLIFYETILYIFYVRIPLEGTNGAKQNFYSKYFNK